MENSDTFLELEINHTQYLILNLKKLNKYLPQLIWNLCMKYILVKIKIKRYGYESHTNVDI